MGHNCFLEDKSSRRCHRYNYIHCTESELSWPPVESLCSQAKKMNLIHPPPVGDVTPGESDEILGSLWCGETAKPAAQKFVTKRQHVFARTHVDNRGIECVCECVDREIPMLRSVFACSGNHHCCRRRRGYCSSSCCGCFRRRRH